MDTVRWRSQIIYDVRMQVGHRFSHSTNQSILVVIVIMVDMLHVVST